MTGQVENHLMHVQGGHRRCTGVKSALYGEGQRSGRSMTDDYRAQLINTSLEQAPSPTKISDILVAVPRRDRPVAKIPSQIADRLATRATSASLLVLPVGRKGDD